MNTLKSIVSCKKAQGKGKAPHLIDFIDDSERTPIQLLQSHQVQHGGDASLAAALVVRRQLVQLRAAAKLDADSNSVFIIVLL